MNTYQAAATDYWHWGANVTALTKGDKAPLNKWIHHQHHRQTLEEVQRLAWDGLPEWKEKNLPARECGGVGFLPGAGDTPWRDIELDGCSDPAVVSTLLYFLGLPSDYAWLAVTRRGYRIVVICPDEIPDGALSLKDRETGVYWGTSKAGNFDHLELRWSECHSILPPSIHPSGIEYQWLHGAPTETPATVSVGHVLAAFYSVANRPQVEVPQPIQKASNETPTPRNNNPARLEAYALTGFDNEVAKLASAGDGQRNKQLFKSAAALGELLAADWFDPAWFSESDVERALETAATRNGLIGDDGQVAFERSLASGLKAGKAKPRNMPPEREIAEAEAKRASLFAGRFDEHAQAETEKVVAKKVDAATVILDDPRDDRYRQFYRDARRIITAPKDAGYDPTTRLALLYVQLELVEQGEGATIARGATAVAEALHMTTDTVRSKLEKLEGAGLVMWHKEPERYDRRGNLLDKHDPEDRQKSGYWKTESTLFLSPLPQRLPFLSETDYDLKQKDKADENRARLKLAGAILEKAVCPCCATGEVGKVKPTCEVCGEKLTREHDAVRGAPDWNELPIQELPASVEALQFDDEEAPTQELPGPDRYPKNKVPYIGPPIYETPARAESIPQGQSEWLPSPLGGYDWPEDGAPLEAWTI